MKNISVEELNEILKKHEMWLKNEKSGERADLMDADLRGIDLSYTNLSGADLRNANLSESDLTYVNLSNADLWNTNLSYSELKCSDLWNTNLSESDLNNADLSYTNLRGANLSYTNLSYTDLRGADLRYANLNNANLWDANLRYAILNNIETNMNTIGYNLACPEEGSFIGYKKASGCMIKLLILDDAERSSATTCKCRCDKAKVLEIKNIKTGERIKETKSNYDPEFIYRVGEIITVGDFDYDRWNEYSPGIYFFMNKENAMNY